METVRKIDYFGGLHGNYLELVVNYWIDQNRSYDITQPQFNANGACHLKNKNVSYTPITIARHWSYLGLVFHDEDYVIRIVPAEQDLLIGLTNSFLRAGDQPLDLHQLHLNTHKKMSDLPKLKMFLKTLVENHGLREHYARSILRKYFYAMFDDYHHGLGMLNNWLPAKRLHHFKFRNFFSLTQFFDGLQKISKFVSMEFLPTPELATLHQNFLAVNQGLTSEIRCQRVLESIVCQQSRDLDLNILEEAWINYNISRIFNLYDVTELETDSYPNNTKIISDICYSKEQCA